jgi:PAS domain-containing protein
MEGDLFKELGDETHEEEQGVWSKLVAVSKKLMLAGYSCFYSVFSHYNATTRFESTSKRHLRYYPEVVVSALQLQSLYYPSFASLPGWSGYSWFETLISIFRLDYLCARLGLALPYFILSLAILLIPFAAFLTMFVKHYRGSEVKPSNYKLLLGFGMDCLRGVLFLPSMCIFIAGVKYSFSSSAQAPEYAGSDLAITYFGATGAIWGLILFTLAFFQSLWQYEQLQSRADTVFTARAHSQVEVLRMTVLAGLAISKFALHYDYQIAHLAMCTILGSYVSYKYAYYLPFYRPLANFLYGLPFVLLVSGGLANLIGYFTGSAETVISITIIMPLPLALVYWDLITRRQAKAQYSGLKAFRSMRSEYSCELVIRSQVKLLLEYDDEANDRNSIKQAIVEMFSELHRVFRDSRMTCVWEFMFAYEALDDESIARLKLSQAVIREFEWEADYLHFKYTSLLKDCRRQYFEEIDYINFRQLYDSAKTKDHSSCKTAMRFWFELSREVPRVELIERLAIKIFHLTNKTQSMLEKLLKEYPKNPLALQIYGSFLLEVFNDTEKGHDLVSKGESERRDQQFRSGAFIEQRFSFFDDANAILIISGDPDTVGQITYANQQASELLGIPGHLLVSTNINAFCPPPIFNTIEHSQVMLKFLERGSSNTVDLPFFCFMLDTYGFLFEVCIQIKCVALESTPFFIAAFRKSPNMRELAIYDDTNVFTCNTKGFAEIVGAGDFGTHVKGRQLFEALPNLKGEIRALKKPFNYLVPNTINTVLMKFEELIIRSRIFKYVHVTNDELEIEDWRQSKVDADIFAKLKVEAPKYHNSGLHKSSLRQPNAPKRDLTVRFDLNPKLYLMQFTDFDPGEKTAVGKVKDATTPKRHESIEFEGDEGEEVVEEAGVMMDITDLKDLSSLMLVSDKQDHDEPNVDASSGSSKNKRRGTSVASSAVSSNSSFTSSNAAQMLLLGVNASIFRFKVSFFVTVSDRQIVVVLASAVAMLVYLLIVAGNFQHKMIVIELSDRSVQTSRLATDTRILQLINSQEYSTDIEAAVRESVLQSCDLLDSIENKIGDVISEWKNGPNTDLYSDPSVMTWDYQDLAVRQSKENLDDALRKIKSAGRAIYNTEQGLITPDNSDYFYLMRNGEGETLKTMNKSIEVFLSNEDDELVSNMQIVFIIGAIAVVLNIICFLAILLPTLISVERSHQSVWGFFYRLPLDIVQEMRFRSEERLETMHGVETEHKSHETEMFKSIEQRRTLKSSRKWPGLLVRLALYYGLCTAYFVYFYVEGYNHFLVMFHDHPKILMWSGLREYAVNSVFFYYQESYFAGTEHDLRHSLDNCFWASAQDELNERLWLLKHSEHKLKQIATSSAMSTKHFDLLYDTGYTTRNEMHFGMDSALQDYVAQFRAYLAQGVHPKELLELRNAMHEAVDSLTDLYSEAADSTVAASKQAFILITVCFALSSLSLFFLVYLPMINVVRSEIVEVFELARLIPIDLLDRILLALKAEKNPIFAVEN